jgi:hypothetical protein
MKLTLFNPQKGRLETVSVDLTEDNTTWFGSRTSDGDISMMTDFDGGLIIKDHDHSYPIWIYDISRADIGYNQQRARRLRRLHE